tara:strand:- start:109 stop:579 length:471 start_codon:yes stop_codon:yes gene_type:complete
MPVKTGKDMTPAERKKRAHTSYSKSWKTGTRKKKNSYEPCASFGGKVVCFGNKKKKEPKKKVDRSKDAKQTPSPVKIADDKKPPMNKKVVSKTPTKAELYAMTSAEIKKLYGKVSIQTLNNMLVAEGIRDKNTTSKAGTKETKIKRLYRAGRRVTP